MLAVQLARSNGPTRPCARSTGKRPSTSPRPGRATTGNAADYCEVILPATGEEIECLTSGRTNVIPGNTRKPRVEVLGMLRSSTDCLMLCASQVLRCYCVARDACASTSFIRSVDGTHGPYVFGALFDSVIFNGVSQAIRMLTLALFVAWPSGPKLPRGGCLLHLFPQAFWATSVSWAMLWHGLLMDALRSTLLANPHTDPSFCRKCMMTPQFSYFRPCPDLRR